MAIRSFIGKVNPDNTITAIYCHYDGYPEGVGAMLHYYYYDSDIVNALLAGGDISQLEPCIERPDGHSFKTPVPGHTVFYMRDRGDDSPASTYSSIEAFKDAAHQVSAEYAYLMMGETWMVLSRFSNEWEPLENVLRVCASRIGNLKVPGLAEAAKLLDSIGA